MDAAPNAAAAPEEGRLAGGIFYRHWHAENPVAVILLAHGAGEHSGRYRVFAEYFVARGIAVVAPDHVGHGESPGRPGHVARFGDYLSPLDQLRAIIDTEYPGSSCFLVGHSMGGLIAARYLLDRQAQFAGAILSGPALEVPEPPPAPAILLNRFISVIWPTLGVLQLDASEVSRDPEVVAAYRADPLVHSGKLSARFVVELFGAMQQVATRRGEIHVPVLAMHGDADVMTAPAGSAHFVAGVGSADKTLRIYPGLYHEIFNEPEHEAVFDDLHNWLRERLPA